MIEVKVPCMCNPKHLLIESIFHFTGTVLEHDESNTQILYLSILIDVCLDNDESQITLKILFKKKLWEYHSNLLYFCSV